MKIWYTTLWAASVFLLTACGGSSTPPKTTPTTKTYGIFRKLNNKPAPAVNSFKQEAAVASINISPRVYHRSLQMLNGKILLVGGDTGNTPTMDIYDPDTESFTPSSVAPSSILKYKTGAGSFYNSFAMTNLPDGRVWIGGANGGNDNAMYYYNLYNPATDTIEKDIPVITLPGENDYPAVGPCDDAYYIGNNKILIFLSLGANAVLDLTTQRVSWLTNPALQGIGSLTDVSSIQDLDGNIWQVGGLVSATMQVLPIICKYNIVTDTWERKADLLSKRYGASLVNLPNNEIGIYGGRDITNLSSVEIYSINNNTVRSSVSLVATRDKAASVYLQTGYTLLCGGVNESGLSVDSELVHKDSISFSGSTGTMTAPRFGHAASVLNNGRVLITGGYGNSTSLSSAEIYDPQSALYISYLSEQVAVGSITQFGSKNATNADVSVTWVSNKPEVGSINADGLFTAVSEGWVEITATLNSNPTTTALVRIHVLPQ